MTTNLLPREKLQKLGAANLTDAELLAILLGSGTQHLPVQKLAQRLLASWPLATSLKTRPTLQKLKKINGIGPAKACAVQACYELAYRLNNPQPAAQINNPEKVFHQAEEIRQKKQEHCLALYLNGRQELLKKKIIAVGNLNTNFVDFRQLLAPLITLPANSLILVHNHPSQNPEPSQADLKVTKKIERACQLIGSQLVDHVIVSKKNYFSCRKNGVIKEG